MQFQTGLFFSGGEGAIVIEHNVFDLPSVKKMRQCFVTFNFPLLKETKSPQWHDVRRACVLVMFRAAINLFI